MEIKERISALRLAMKEAGHKAYIIPSSDAHLSEYTPEHWKARRYISGFTGSAGTVVITENKAGLWTDSRYFLQGEKELAGSGIELYKMGNLGVPSIDAFLANELQEGDVVGCDGQCYIHADAIALESTLDIYGIQLDVTKDLFGTHVWPERPSIPTLPLFAQPVMYAGESAASKIERCRQALKAKGTNSYIITMLDELAWVYNLRGRDVECNPVGVAYGFISDKEAILFVMPEKVNDDLRRELEAEGITIKPYTEAYQYVAKLPTSARIFIDPKRINEAFCRAIPQGCRIVEGVSDITMMKAIKNETELQGVRAAMRRDGVALTRFFIWLEGVLANGETPDEVEIGHKLTAIRRQQDLYFGDSFDTIAGYQGHGAIVHYKAEKNSAYKLKPQGVLLLDSGGQYSDGTTDITRTVSLDGSPSEEVRRDYTLVMKGHIGIATAHFPEGTRGSQLDILARKALWDQGFNYGHGTGHGVGCFLNVHEGPQSIRMDENPTVLRIGMITSNEPGLYRADKWGIRIENLIVTREVETTEFGQFLGFETLTLFCFDNTMIDKSLLTASEVAWYNDYQEMVYRELSPLLSADEAAWLAQKTLAI